MQERQLNYRSFQNYHHVWSSILEVAGLPISGNTLGTEYWMRDERHQIDLLQPAQTKVLKKRVLPPHLSSILPSVGLMPEEDSV